MYSLEKEPLSCLPSADLSSLVANRELLIEPRLETRAGAAAAPGGSGGLVGSRHLRARPRWSCAHKQQVLCGLCSAACHQGLSPAPSSLPGYIWSSRGRSRGRQGGPGAQPLPSFKIPRLGEGWAARPSLQQPTHLARRYSQIEHPSWRHPLLTGRKPSSSFSGCRWNPFATNNKNVCGALYGSWLQPILPVAP